MSLKVAYVGKVLGGTSMINLMIAMRGSREDWDRISDITQDARWSWDSILPYAKKARSSLRIRSIPVTYCYRHSQSLPIGRKVDDANK